MSLQGLMSGAECAVPFNPLSQVLKHTEGDRSIQQDRIAGPSSSRQLQYLPSSATVPGSERDLALARQFFDGNPTASNAGPAFSVPAHLPHSAEISRLHTPDLQSAWAVNNQPHGMLSHRAGPSGPIADHKASSGWAHEFGNRPQAMSVGSGLQQQGSALSNFSQSQYRPMMGASSTYPMNMSSYAPSPSQTTSAGKGKAREIDFESAFAQLDLEGIISPGAAAAAAQEAAQKAQSQQEQEPLDSSEFKNVWNHLRDSELPPAQEDMAKWEAEYNQLMNSHREDLDFDYGSTMQGAWENAAGEYDDTYGGLKFDDQGIPSLGDYVFETNNKYLNQPDNASLLAAAKESLGQDGSLTEIALLLEAAIQKGDTGKGGYEAWILLGEVRSQDEREDAAMRALTRGVELAEKAGDAGEGMMSLAISFTNESFEKASYTMLLRWLHARYPTHPIPEETWKSLTNSAWHSHESVTNVYLALAREQHRQGILDADVQAGLGVLFYTDGVYDRAKDCFEAALSARPDDYLLWNRLGSCLSNGNHAEESLGAYRQALQLRPTYTRAIYNVGVACLNIGAFKEATEHFLSAAAMQQNTSTNGTHGDQVWFTLRRALGSMNRPDLIEQANPGVNLEIFRKEGFDF